MIDPLIVRAGERGVVRVFSLTIEAGEAQALKTPRALDAALGVQGLEAEFVEAFPLSDLAGIGLADYLTDGCGVPEAMIEPERERLDALEGHVVVVLSKAFGGQEAQISPTAQLTLVGAYSETPTDWSSNGPIETKSARPGSGVATAPRARRSNARRIGAAVFTLFLLLFVLIFALVVF